MDVKKYVVKQKKAGFNPVPLSELMEAKFCHEPADAPEIPDQPEGEWYCHNEECVVREVIVSAKLFDGEKMPAMDCPACHKRMFFNHWLVVEMLVPEKDNG